jgi:Putative restriction endonuclease
MTLPISREELILKADTIGIKLEFIGGLPVWEASPVALHQLEVDRLRSSIKPQVESVHLADSLFKFPDDSLKRPDIAILCTLPPREELGQALRVVPEAVVEIISEGYEDKDLKLAPGFYLGQGVKDVLIFHPVTLEVWHHRRDGVVGFTSPKTLSLECGCEITV